MRKILLLAILGWVSFGAQSVQACLACYAMPEATLADRGIDADAVVLMREDAGHPLRYAVVQVLKGVGDDLPPPPFLIYSTTRAALAHEAATVVLGTWSEFHSWQLHGVASACLQAVVIASVGRRA